MIPIMCFHGDARLVAGADTQPRLADEQRRIGELYDEGFIEQLFRRTDGSGAWLIVQADDEESAHRGLDTLPFVEIGIMTMHLSAVEPVDITQF
jgi:muconolactone delta-isomerase